MIYIFTALYCEASLFIRQFHLTKNPENTRFQEFYNETAGIRLTVTGVGEISAATAVSSVCTTYRPAQEDILLNIGTCACRTKDSGIFLCNKIVEQATGKTFYPDILYHHDFCESTIVTGMLPYDRKSDGDISVGASEGELYDMEAAAVYQAGSHFFGPHQMVFIKLVSDRGTPESISTDQVGQLLENVSDQLCSFVKQLNNMSSGHAQAENSLHQELEALTEQLCADLHCSKVMSDSLRQHIRYFALSGTDVTSVIQEMYAKGMIPCKDKREGKLRFEELKRRLFQ